MKHITFVFNWQLYSTQNKHIHSYLTEYRRLCTEAMNASLWEKEILEKIYERIDSIKSSIFRSSVNMFSSIVVHES